MKHRTSFILGTLEQAEPSKPRSEFDVPESTEPTLQPSADSDLKALLRACLGATNSKEPKPS